MEIPPSEFRACPLRTRAVQLRVLGPQRFARKTNMAQVLSALTCGHSLQQSSFSKNFYFHKSRPTRLMEF